jgi:hypothetical protein
VAEAYAKIRTEPSRFPGSRLVCLRRTCLSARSSPSSGGCLEIPKRFGFSPTQAGARFNDIGKILVESMEHEAAALALYKDLLTAVEGRSVMLEEYARQMIYAEELHAGDVDKMLRKPGEISATGLGPQAL